MEWYNYIILATALVGASLGILNYWSAHRKTQVKIKIIPRISRTFGRGPNAHGQPTLFVLSSVKGLPRKGLAGSEMILADIINLSEFPVTIETVGFRLHGTKGTLFTPVPLTTDSGDWPRRLGPREAFCVYFRIQDLTQNKNYLRIKDVYVKTSCEHVFSGTSKAFRDFLPSLREFGSK